MPTTMTLDGVRMNRFKSFLRNVLPTHLHGVALGDAWSDDESTSGTDSVADFTTTFIGYGILAFAGASAVIRGYRAVKKLI